MKFFQRRVMPASLVLAAIILSSIVLSSCTNAKSKQSETPVYLSSSETELKTLVDGMNEPRGLVSCTLRDIVGTPGDVLLLKKDQSSDTGCEDRTAFHEYFIYDENDTIFVLQSSPLIFFYVKSTEFYFQLNNEFNQFVENPTLGAADKLKNSQTYYRQVGDYEIALTFTPNEMLYSDRGANEGRIQDRNSASYIDFWRLLDAAGEASVYVPDEFEEQRLFTDVYCHVQKGKSRKLFSPLSRMTLSSLPDWFRDPTDERFDEECYNAQRDDKSTIRPWYELKSDLDGKVEFFASFGRDLEINDALLGSEDIEYADRLGLTRPYAFFLTVPLGNTEESDFEKDYVSNRHGIGIQIRGNIDSLHSQAKSLGIPGLDTTFSPVRVLSAVNQGTSITLNWSEAADVQVLHYATSSEKSIEFVESLSDSSFVTVANVLGKNEATLTVESSTGTCVSGTISRGCAHWFRISGIDTTPSVTVAVVPRTPAADEIIFTEVMWMGTQQTDANDYNDEWFEIKNDTSEILDLSQIDIYNVDQGASPVDQSGIVAGPNFNASATLDGHEPLGSSAADPDPYLYPGEYAVVARYADRFLANFSGIKIFDRTLGYFSDGGKDLYLGIDLDGTTLDVTIDSVIDFTAGINDVPDKSQVLTGIPDTWATSAIDSNQPSSGLNYATPGYAGAGEY